MLFSRDFFPISRCLCDSQYVSRHMSHLEQTLFLSSLLALLTFVVFLFILVSFSIHYMKPSLIEPFRRTLSCASCIHSFILICQQKCTVAHMCTFFSTLKALFFWFEVCKSNHECRLCLLSGGGQRNEFAMEI